MESIIKALAEELGVEESELRSWLNFRVTEGKVIAEPKTFLGPRFKNVASAVQRMNGRWVRGWGGERSHFEVPFKKGTENIDKICGFFPERLRETLTFEEEPDSWVVKPAEETKPEDINELAEATERMGGISLFIGGKSCFRIPKTAVAEKELKPVSRHEGKAPSTEEARRMQPSVIEKTEGKFETIPIGALSPSPFDVRPKEDQELNELAENIKNIGVLEPIIVRKKPDGTYEVVCGMRRLRAANMAGLAEVPCVIRDLSDEEVLLAQISENVARKGVPDVAKAYQLKQLINAGYTQTQLAERLGKSEAWVSRHLRMLELETFLPRGKKVLGKMTEGQARVILSAPDDVQKKVAEWMEYEFEKSEELPSAREIQEKINSFMVERELKVEAPTSKPEEISAPIKCSNCKNLTYSPHFLKDGRVLCDGCFESLSKEGLITEENMIEGPKVEAKPRIPERAKVYCPICGHVIGARVAEVVDRLKKHFPEFFKELKGGLEE